MEIKIPKFYAVNYYLRTNHLAAEEPEPASIRGGKNLFFYPGSCSNIGSEPFFIREILDMTGIDIEKIGDPNALCFEIHIPGGGYRFFRRIFFKEKAPGPRPFPRLIL